MVGELRNPASGKGSGRAELVADVAALGWPRCGDGTAIASAGDSGWLLATRSSVNTSDRTDLLLGLCLVRRLSIGAATLDLLRDSLGS